MEQATNLFSKGLQLDTNPMVLGNDTLSDALNATFITMNGDEVILQNDMGNRRVDGAFLPPGYLPVGMKEYGGIIYVASYNPITNRSQVGSFPSPERNIQPNEFDGKSDIRLRIFSSPISNGFCVNEEEGIPFLANRSFLIPITEDTSLHAGDKFTIYSEYLYRGYLQNLETIVDDGDLYKEYTELSTLNDRILISDLFSNFNNIDETSGRVKSPKNKKYTLAVGVINSLNEFVDITNSLVRWDDEGNILDTSEDSELVKFNKGYFIASKKPSTSEDTILDKLFKEARQIIPSNTYSFKLVSPLYLKTTLNTIQNFSCNLVPSKDDNYIYINITADIEYNCPDGVEEKNESNDDIYYSLEEGKPNKTFIGFDLFLKNYSKEEEIEELTELTENYYKVEDNNIYNNILPTKYNPQTNTYSTKIFKQYKLKINNFKFGKSNEDNEDKLIYYYICVSDTSIYYLKELSLKGVLDINLINSGTVLLNRWNYIWNDTGNKKLNYGIQVYPRENETYKDLILYYENIISSNNSSIVDYLGTTYYQEPINPLPEGWTYSLLDNDDEYEGYYTYIYTDAVASNVGELPETLTFNGITYYKNYEKYNAKCLKVYCLYGNGSYRPMHTYQAIEVIPNCDDCGEITLISGTFSGIISNSITDLSFLLRALMYLCSLKYTIITQTEGFENSTSVIKSIGNIQLSEDYFHKKLWILTTPYFNNHKQLDFSTIKEEFVDYDPEAKLIMGDISYNDYQSNLIIPYSIDPVNNYDYTNEIKAEIPITASWNENNIIKNSLGIIPYDIACLEDLDKIQLEVYKYLHKYKNLEDLGLEVINDLSDLIDFKLIIPESEEDIPKPEPVEVTLTITIEKDDDSFIHPVSFEDCIEEFTIVDLEGEHLLYIPRLLLENIVKKEIVLNKNKYIRFFIKLKDDVIGELSVISPTTIRYKPLLSLNDSNLYEFYYPVTTNVEHRLCIRKKGSIPLSNSLDEENPQLGEDPSLGGLQIEPYNPIIDNDENPNLEVDDDSLNTHSGGVHLDPFSWAIYEDNTDLITEENIENSNGRIHRAQVVEGEENQIDDLGILILKNEETKTVISTFNQVGTFKLENLKKDVPVKNYLSQLYDNDESKDSPLKELIESQLKSPQFQIEYYKKPNNKFCFEKGSSSNSDSLVRLDTNASMLHEFSWTTEEYNKREPKWRLSLNDSRYNEIFNNHINNYIKDRIIFAGYGEDFSSRQILDGSNIGNWNGWENYNMDDPLQVGEAHNALVNIINRKRHPIIRVWMKYKNESNEDCWALFNEILLTIDDNDEIKIDNNGNTRQIDANDANKESVKKVAYDTIKKLLYKDFKSSSYSHYYGKFDNKSYTASVYAIDTTSYYFIVIIEIEVKFDYKVNLRGITINNKYENEEENELPQRIPIFKLLKSEKSGSTSFNLSSEDQNKGQFFNDMDAILSSNSIEYWTSNDNFNKKLSKDAEIRKTLSKNTLFDILGENPEILHFWNNKYLYTDDNENLYWPSLNITTYDVNESYVNFNNDESDISTSEPNQYFYFLLDQDAYQDYQGLLIYDCPRIY